MFNYKKFHSFILNCLKGKKQINLIVKKNLYKKTKLFGYFIPDLNKIYIDCNNNEKEFHTTIFHEIAHVFFHDEYDNRKNKYILRRDPKELRAENLAENVYLWYNKKENKRQYNNVKKEINRLPIKKLTEKELNDIF